MLTGRVDGHHRRTAARREHRRVPVPRPRRAARAAARLRLLPRRHVALEAELHPQPRASLRAAAAVHLAEQQLLEGDDRRRLRGVGDRPQRRLQPLPAGRTLGRDRQFLQFNEGEAAYNTDRNNFAPNVGFAWTLPAAAGILGSIFGPQEGDSVLRGGYTLGYNRPGMSDFTAAIDDNPGISQTRPQSHHREPGHAGIDLPPQPGRSWAACRFSTTRDYPMTDVVTGDILTFDPNLQVPYSQTWTAGWQRKLTSDIAIEARYVGTALAPELAELQLQRGQHRRERLPRRVPPRAAEPAGEHRRRPRLELPLLRAGHRHVAAADLRGVLQPAAPTRPTRRAYSSAQLREQHVRRTTLRDSQPGSRRAGQRPRRRRGASSERAERRAPGELPRHQPELPGWRRDRRQWRLHEVQRGCSSSCGSACRTASSSTPATCSARPTSRSAFGFRQPRVKVLDTGTEGRRHPRVQGELDLRAALRPGSTVRRRRPGRCSTGVIGGWSFDGIARIQSGRLLQPSGRSPGRDDRDRSCRTTSSSGSITTGKVVYNAAAGHHRQHRQGVQRQRDVGRRLQRPGRSRGPLPGAGERARTASRSPRISASAARRRSRSPDRRSSGST